MEFDHISFISNAIKLRFTFLFVVHVNSMEFNIIFVISPENYSYGISILEIPNFKSIIMLTNHKMYLISGMKTFQGISMYTRNINDVFVDKIL